MKLSNIISSSTDRKLRDLSTNDLDTENTLQLKWEEIRVDERPPAREFPCLSYDKQNQCVYLFGGFGNTYLNDFWKFDLASREWTEIETTGTAPTPRCGCSGCYAPSRGKFYVFGGYHGDYLKDFYELDLETNEWQLLNYSHDIPSLTVLSLNTDASKDYLTIFGGYTMSKYVTDMYHFDFNRNKWENSVRNLINSDGHTFHSRCITLRGKYRGIPNYNNFLILYYSKGTTIYEYDEEEGELIKYKVPKKLESTFEKLDAKFICEINEDTLLILENTELYLIEIRKLKSTKGLDYFINNLKERIQNFSDISFIN